ncbi:dynein axonemal assembly factor 8 isoform X2 [Peromyscus californicus insignis]|uniref:dynein axonemal assembly factor 8 isoform X2 n=1 Tax=Peromyscus californicus insignis TaxID=564181 RepID=UPI0022A71C3E|nr:dynein axonemal assembly factor 8 isoform X2 [Peromyscus californicus insignis]
MTSKDKDVVSLPVSPWDAILKAAKDQLPSLDSDSSLPLLSPGRLAIEPRSGQKVRQEDLAPQGRGGPGWSHQSSPHPILVETEEDLPWLEGNLRSPSYPKGPQSPPWTSQGEEATFPLEGKLKIEPTDTDFRNSTKLQALRRERRRMIEKDILQKVTQAAQNPACGDQGQAAESGPWPEASSEQPREGCPVLSLQQLEDWDLDYILQSLPGRQDSQGDSAPRTAWWLAERYQNQGHTTGLSQDTLLEQLALLCATQSRVCNHTWKVPVDKPQDTEEQEARSRSALAESRRLKTEPPTIFIDLRQTEPEPSEPQEHQARESSEYSSSDSEEEGVETAGPVQGPSSQERRDCTGKSQLLQQLRAFRKGTTSHQSTSDSTRSQKAQAPEDTGSHTRSKKHIKLWAGKQNALDLGDPFGTQPAREVLLPATGQLYSTQVKDLKSRSGGRFRSTQPWWSLYSLPLEAETLTLDHTKPV